MKERTKLPLTIAEIQADQIAIAVDSIEDSILSYDTAGIVAKESWVQDEVLAINLDSNRRFSYHLAFNYTLFPVEFELIQSTSDPLIHLGPRDTYSLPTLSHIGFHVDSAQKAAEKFNLLGYTVIQEVKTIAHTGTDKKYKYIFVDTKPLGFVSKLIERI